MLSLGRRLLSPNLGSLSGLDPVQAAYMTKEHCIAVDDEDKILSQVTKGDAHSRSTMVLHRAFSVFAFTPDRKLILQKRSDSKITFPNMWTNTCCSHPLYLDNEVDGVAGVRNAACRKIEHELGVSGLLPHEFIFQGKFLYKAEMEDSPWGEHELDYALILKNLDPSLIKRNPEEVSDVMYVSLDELRCYMSERQLIFTPWLNLFYKLDRLQQWWTSLDTVSDVSSSQIVKMN